MTDLDLDAIEARAAKAPSPWLLASDVPALVSALREARAQYEARKADWKVALGERDDWRRRYEALRDGVTEICDEAERSNASAVPVPAPAPMWSVHLSAVVARVEES